MIFSPMTTSFSRKRNLPTPPPSVSDINDSSSSCSSTSSSLISYSNETNNTVSSCDLIHILTDARFRPVFQAIDEIKRRKCRPDFERIIKYVSKRYPTPTDHRNEILSILDELLKYGLITKVFHKGGFTIRIKNEKYAKLIENLTPAIVEQEAIQHSASHKRETPSPEFDLFKTDDPCQMTKENNLIPTKKRNRSQTDPSSTAAAAIKTKKSRVMNASESTENIIRKPLVTNNNHLPPITIEQLLGLRGDIPDVHNWTTDDLIGFFHQQGYEYASTVLTEHHINGDKLYELKREQVFHRSTLKIGKALKLWNVIEQIQRNNLSE